MIVHFPHYIKLFKWQKQGDIISTLYRKPENKIWYVLEGSSERRLRWWL